MAPFAGAVEFTTSFRTYLKTEVFVNTHFFGMLNNTIYWDMVQDNDDGDRFKDRRYGSIVGFAKDNRSFDLDGVLLGQDEDNDGFRICDVPADCNDDDPMIRGLALR